MSKQKVDNNLLNAYEVDVETRSDGAQRQNVNVINQLVPKSFDYIVPTYVAAGNGQGEIETVTYKEGGAAGTTIATLTLTYDASNNISSVTRS